MLDHNQHPVAGVAVTFPVDEEVDRERLASAVRATAQSLTRRLGG